MSRIPACCALGRLTLLLVLAGCSTDQASLGDAPTIPVASETLLREVSDRSSTPSDEPIEKRFKGISLTIPAGWQERPPASEFVQAEFALDGPGGPARLTLSSAGGGIEANLERWRGQLTPGPNDPPPQQSTVSVDGREAVVLELTGEFRDQFSGGVPQADWSLLGAIIPTGPANFFLKLTGPRETVTAHRQAFRRVVETARLDD